jgi:hypothetical protein
MSSNDTDAELDEILEELKIRKIDLVAQGGADGDDNVDGDDDLPFTIDCWRDGLRIAVLIFGQAIPDIVLKAAHMAIIGFNADRVVVCNEGYIQNLITDPTAPPYGINPATGREWEHGELGEVFTSGQHPGVVVETLNVLDVRRDGTGWMCGAPYERTARQVRWLPKLTMIEIDGIDGGRVPDALHHAFAQPCMLDEARPAIDELGLDLAYAQTAMDITTAKLLMARIPYIAVMLATRDPQSHAMIGNAFLDSTLQDFRQGVLLAKEKAGASAERLVLARAMLYGSGLNNEWDIIEVDADADPSGS